MIEISPPILKYIPKNYAGEESITFPNGLIFKHGFKTRSDINTTVTFGVAFNTFVSVSITIDNSTAQQLTATVHSESASGFIINTANAYTGFYWQAWGY